MVVVVVVMGHLGRHIRFFFASNVKTLARNQAAFPLHFHISLTHPSGKSQNKVISDQAIRIGQVTLRPKIFYFPVATVFKGLM